jgi:hypothetical protein
MAKRITKPKEKAVEPSWYTVGWSYPEPLRGGAVGGSLEVRAKDEAEAQATVEAKLRAKGHTWKDITIVKGRDPGLTRKGGTERHYAELQAMLGIGRLALHAWSDVEPRPMWASPDVMPDPDATARTGWAKFMDESSYGLSVSAFPHFIIPDVEGYPTLPLPAEAVRNPKRWEAITSDVRDQLDYWKGTLQERIERLGKAKRRSTEEAAQLKRDKATLKQLQAFDGWTYQGFVEAMLPGRKPDPRDLDNLRLYRLSNGQLIPITNLGRDQLRVDFWRRLLSLWDGPVDKRAELVRGFLDHHHRKGGKPEQFRDLVKDTLPRLRKLTGRELLVDKVEGWLQRASASSSSVKRTELQAMPFEREAAAQFAQLLRDELPGFSICHYPKRLAIGTRETYPDVEPGIEATDAGVRSVENWNGIDKAVKQAVERKLPDGELKDKLTGWTYASIVPEGIPNPFDIPNPREYLLDGALIPSERFVIRGRLSKAANDAFVAFQRQLKRAWTSPMNLRKGKVAEYLDHHFANGGNPNAFVDFVEAAGPSISITGNTRSFTYEEALQKELAAWLVTARKRLGGGAKMYGKPNAPKPTAPTLASKFETVPGSLDKWMGLLRSEGLVNEVGSFTMASGVRGKGKLIAAWDAAQSVFSLTPFPSGAELKRALNIHFDGLAFSGRLDRVRFTNDFDTVRDGYKEVLRGN